MSAPHLRSWADETLVLVRRADACASASDKARFLRDARDHLSGAPNAVALVLGEGADAKTFEALLSLGAFDAAARRLGDADRFGYLASRAPRGSAMVTLSLHGGSYEISHAHSCEGVAFAAALLKLVDLLAVPSPVQAIAAARADKLH